MARPLPPWHNPKVVTSALSGMLLLVGFLTGRLEAPAWVPLALYIAASLTGGSCFGREAITELVYEREVGIELLMAIAAVVATLMGQAGEGAMLVFLYSISEAAEGYTEEKTRSAIRALMDLTPKMALVRRERREVEVPVEALAEGDVFLVKPGQSLATDGEVVAGASSVNQAPVTGESVPVEKQPGDMVFAGSINGEGALDIRATKTYADNTIARVIHLVEAAQEQKGTSQRFIERFGARYSPAVLLIGLAVAMVPPVLTDAAWAVWITRATVFIVAAAPCALAISIPVTLVASLGTGARQGVLIKGGRSMEALARIRVVALDKTGTLTRGEPEVTDLVPLQAGNVHGIPSPQAMLAVAAGIERRSQHPLAQALLRYTDAQGITPAAVTDVRSLTGAGASGCYNSTRVYTGSPALFEQQLHIHLSQAQDMVRRLQGEGKTVIVVGDERTAWGLLALRDTLRPNARTAIAALHTVGVEKVVMLTGDNVRTAAAIAHEAGIHEYYADLTPDAKVLRVRELAERYGHVAMVGDGVNDAPALAAATVGVAMGAVGTDVALETADVALMADDLARLVYALRLARRTQTVVRQNLAVSAVVIGGLVIGAITGVFSLPVAVLGHEISEFMVIGNGLRMLRA